MTQNDDEHEESDDVNNDQDEEAETEDRSSVAPDRLRESIRQIVDDALKETMELRGKGRVLKVALADDLGRIGREVRKVVEGATAGICNIDIRTLKNGLKGRTNTLMTRVKDEDIKRMDLLVESGLFESRSACAAFLIHAGLDARKDLVAKVQETAERIGELKEELRRELSGEEA